MIRAWRITLLLLLINLLSGFTLFSEQPEYCKSTSNADASACFASHPAYCESTSYANSGACFLANVSYCESDRNANTGACFTSHPTYCSSSTYAPTPGPASLPTQPIVRAIVMPILVHALHHTQHIAVVRTMPMCPPVRVQGLHTVKTASTQTRMHAPGTRNLTLNEL